MDKCDAARFISPREVALAQAADGSIVLLLRHAEIPFERREEDFIVGL